MISTGKRLEQNFRNSVPKNVFFYRLRDSATSFYQNKDNNIRFTPSNLCDAILFDGKTLLLCELKHHFGKSIPLSVIEGNKTKQKQIIDLFNASKYDNVRSLLIIYLSDVNKCFALDINKYLFFKENYDRKSIPLDFLENSAIDLKITQLKVNFKIDLSNILNI